MTALSAKQLAQYLNITPRHVRNCFADGMPNDRRGARAWWRARLEERARALTLRVRERRCRYCDKGPLGGKHRRVCDSCRSERAALAAARRPKGIRRKTTPRPAPHWTARARELYESGDSSTTVATKCNVSLASVNSWMLRQQWDRGRHRLNSHPDQRLDLPALRTSYEGGCDPIGMSETSFRYLARRQGWDASKRREAIGL